MNAVKGLLLAACVGLMGSAADAATLTITTNGSNSGAVAVGGTGNVCNPANGGTCVFTIANGTEIRLAANSPATPGVFSAGTGDAAVCGPTSTCKFILSTDSSIVATFNAGSYPSLQIILAGDGKGEVSPDNNRCQNFELGYSACTTYLRGRVRSDDAGAFDAWQYLHELFGRHRQCGRVRRDQSLRVHPDGEQHGDGELLGVGICLGATSHATRNVGRPSILRCYWSTSATAPREPCRPVRDVGERHVDELSEISASRPAC